MRGRAIAVTIVFILLSGLAMSSDPTLTPDGISCIKIFRDTPAWHLALAVRWQVGWAIRLIVNRNPDLLDYQDPAYGTTLLLWSVGNEKYRSARTLLELGADPNIPATYDGETPLHLAAGFSWVNFALWPNRNAKFVHLLLEYGADPNITVAGRHNPLWPESSPLMNSIDAGLEKTMALVEAGADINYRNLLGQTAALIALFTGSRVPSYAHYLIVEKKADVQRPYWTIWNSPETSVGRFPVDLLRSWVFPLDSDKYRMKMEVVEEFARQGVNYWETEIPERILRSIQVRYPDTWEEYVKRY